MNMNMNMNKVLHVSCIIVVLFISGCATVQSTKKPDEFSSNDDLQLQESVINTKVRVKLDDIEAKVNEIFKQPIKDSGKGEFKKIYVPKTKNPRYDPSKWLITNNPKYSPNKMIKECWKESGLVSFTVCGKTNNPFYDSRKTLKTKNPNYSPNKWTFLPKATVQIGYKYNYSIKKRDKVTFHNIDANTLRVTVPMTLDAHVGFRGDLAKVAQASKKKVNADVDVNIDFKIGFNSKWCPVIDANIDIDWKKGPMFEVAGGIWLDFNFPTELATPSFERSAENILTGLIDCEAIQKHVASTVKPLSFPLDGELKGLNANLTPNVVYAPVISYHNDELQISLGLKSLVTVSNTPLKDTTFKLPPLTVGEPIANRLILTVPLQVEYDFVDDKLANLLPSINTEITKWIKDSSNDIIKSVRSLKINSVEVYPSGERLTLGVNFELLSKIDTFSTTGNMYLTSSVDMSDNKTLRLRNVSLTPQLDNDLYNVLVILVDDILADQLEKHAYYDLTSLIAEGKTKALSTITEKLNEYANIELINQDIHVDITKDAILKSRYIVKPLVVVSGFEVKVKDL